jgi:hypothetical protein
MINANPLSEGILLRNCSNPSGLAGEAAIPIIAINSSQGDESEIFACEFTSSFNLDHLFLCCAVSVKETLVQESLIDLFLRNHTRILASKPSISMSGDYIIDIISDRFRNVYHDVQNWPYSVHPPSNLKCSG